MNETVNINQAEKERVKIALARLPVLDERSFLVDFAARMICAFIEIARTGNSSLTEGKDRKPVAAVARNVSASSYEFLTGLEVTRVSKDVAGKRGKQEAGAFAAFLDELFDILDIEASAAGQVALLKRQRRKGRPPMETS